MFDFLKKLVHTPEKEIPKPEPVIPRNKPEPLEESAVDPGELMHIMQDEPLHNYSDLGQEPSDESDYNENHSDPQDDEEEEEKSPEEQIKDGTIDHYDFVVDDKFTFRRAGSDRFYVVDMDGYIYRLSTRTPLNVLTWKDVSHGSKVQMTNEEDDERGDDVFTYRILKEDEDGNSGTKEGTSVARPTDD